MRKKYQNPPINELVIGVYFDSPILQMRSEHAGLFWCQLIDKFPSSLQNVPIGQNFGETVPGEIFPMPRFWFISEDDSYLLQIQRDAILLNWRKRQENYPHYEPIKSIFDECLDKYQNFCTEIFGLPDFPIRRCDLTYINIISEEEYFNNFDDVGVVLPSFSPPIIDEGGSRPAAFNLRYDYFVNSDLSLIVSLQSRRDQTTETDALYLELRGSGELETQSRAEADRWFGRAHNVIGDAFNTLTNLEIQTEHWKPREE